MVALYAWKRAEMGVQFVSHVLNSTVMKRNLNLIIGVCLVAAALPSCTKADLDVVLPEDPSEQDESSLSGSTDNTGETVTAYSQSSGSLSAKGNTYISNTSDVNAVKVSGGTFSMENCTIQKTGGDTSDNDGSSFYGTNSAILSTGEGTVTMNGGAITTNAKGANGVVAYQGTVNISDVVINCSKSVSRGIHANGDCRERRRHQSKRTQVILFQPIRRREAPVVEYFSRKAFLRLCYRRSPDVL